MKTLKVICTSMVLGLVLSVPAYAGDISTPGITSSDPTAPATEPGEIHTTGLTAPASSQVSADVVGFLLTLVF